MIGAALLGVQWSGAISPQLSVPAGGSGETQDGREYRMVLLRNNGLLPPRVEAVDWPTEGWSDVRAGVLPAGVSYEGPHPPHLVPGDRTIQPFTIGGGFGEGRWIVVSGRPTWPAEPRSEVLEASSLVENAHGISFLRASFRGTPSSSPS